MIKAKDEGPYVQAATFCREILREDDGTISLIRMVDILTHTKSGPGAPKEMPTLPVSTKAVIAFKSGGVSGEFTAKMEFISPSGKKIEEITQQFKLTGVGHGYNILANLSFEATEEGLYWLNVRVEDELVTRVPLQIRYKRVTEQDKNH